MSDQDRDRKRSEERIGGSGAGRSGSARDIGAELGDLDFEPDALLDSLMMDDEPPPNLSPSARAAVAALPTEPPPTPAVPAIPPAPRAPGVVAPAAPSIVDAEPSSQPGPKLHEPPRRMFSPDEVTMVGEVSAPEGDVDDLLADPDGAVPTPMKVPLPPRPAAPPRPAPPPAVAPPPAPSISERADSSDPIEFDDDDDLGDDAVFESLSPGSFTELDDDVPLRSFDDAEAPELETGRASIDFSMSELDDAPVERADSYQEVSSGEWERASIDDSSERPPSVTRLESRAPAALNDEQPAADHLTALGLSELWTERADFLVSESAKLSDPQAKMRALTVASELYAMSGDFVKARQHAELAAQTTDSVLARRQHRWLAATDGDWTSVGTMLDVELERAPTPVARYHAGYLAAEIQRIQLGDPVGAARKLDACVRVDANDSRAQVLRLVQALAADPGPPSSVVLPEAESLASLRRANQDVSRLRGDSQASSELPAAAFEAARRALDDGDRQAAGTAVAQLGDVDELTAPARWLGAALLSTNRNVRPQAMSLLRELMAIADGPEVRQTLVSRALEQGDSEVLSEAFATESMESAPFSAADRVALGALTGGDASVLRPPISELEEDVALRPLAAAADALISRPGEGHVLAGEAESRAETALGRALAQAERVALDDATQEFASTHPDHALTRVLNLELALENKQASRIADEIASWPGDESPGDTRNAHLAAAFVLEAADELAGARANYADALAAEPSTEAAARALISLGADNAPELLAGLADGAPDETHRSLLLVEAALRTGFENSEQVELLLSRAADAAPSLPFSYRLGEYLARARGDADALLSWLRLRREATDDETERALDQVREALLIADSDMESAAALLEAASNVRPGDIGLCELFERLHPGVAATRGQWRERAAETAEPHAKQRLLHAAALEYERAEDYASAARVTELTGQDSDFGAVTTERLATLGAGGTKLSEKLFALARSEQDPDKQREVYERLSRLDGARGENASALLWQSAILERKPNHLPALRRLEHAYIGAGRDDELEPIAGALARLVDRNEATAHAFLAVRLRTRRGEWDSGRELVQLAANQDSPGLWSLRQLSAHARAAGDDEELLRADRTLSEHASRAIDAATLALRASEAATRLGLIDDARELLARAVEMIPEHLVALTTQAEVLEAAGDFTGAARSLEALAEASAVDAHRLQSFYHAGVLWMDKLADMDRARVCFERAVDLDVGFSDVFERLRTIYVQAGEQTKLAELLESRLAGIEDPEERVALEVTRGRALAEMGEREQAKAALSAALDANPDHVEALDTFGELCAAEGDWEGAEQAWIRLARHASDPARQAAIYRKLGDLYDGQLDNPERAELAFKEVLKRQPHDVETNEKLVYVYGRLGQVEQAVQLMTDLTNRATDDAQKRARTLALAHVLETVANDRRRAEQTLDRARKTWAHDAAVLRSVAEFHERGGEAQALHVLLDRSAADARRALSTGRFDASFFEVLATVAELRGQSDQAAIAQATLAALQGEDRSVEGVGPSAGDPALDELLAPELLTLPLRTLLKKSGDALDAAYAVDLRGLRAAPLPAQQAQYANHVQQVAAQFGLLNIEVFVSPALGPVCMPVSTAPPRLVFGSSLLEHSDERARFFLLVRALKILQCQGAALSRTAPVELWPMFAAYLSIFASNFQPQGVDARKFAEAKQRITSAMTRRLDDDAPVLALEVIGSIGNRATQLATALNQWGNRAALLASGNPGLAFRALAFSAGQMSGPPEDVDDRTKWVVRNPEARDVAVFSVSEQYADARRRLMR